MRTQTYIEATKGHFGPKAASIDEFFEDHMSLSEFRLDEMEEARILEKDLEPVGEDMEDPEEWFHSLYQREPGPRL